MVQKTKLLILPLVLTLISVPLAFGQDTSDTRQGLDDVEPYVISPLKQYNAGVLAEQIVCENNKTLMLRPNSEPACVYETSVEKLEMRNWVVLYTQDTVSLSPEHDTSYTVSESSDVTFSEPCLFCSTLELSSFPKIGEIATATLHVPSSTHINIPEDWGMNVYFYSTDPDAVEFLNVEPITVISKNDGSVQDIYRMPFVTESNKPSTFSIQFKIIKTGQFSINGGITDNESNFVTLLVTEDGTEEFVPQYAPPPVLTELYAKEIKELRAIIDKRGGVGPEIINVGDSEILMDIIRFEGLLTEQEAEYYLTLVLTNATRHYGDEGLPWRQVEQRKISDTSLALFINGYKYIENHPTQVLGTYYSDWGADRWNDGYDSTLEDIRRYLAQGNYMTQSQIDQYIKDYIADDFLDTQNFSFSFLPKAYAATTIHLKGWILADPSFSDKTDDRISGIEVCGQKKIPNGYMTLKTTRNLPACDITDENGKFVIASARLDTSSITLSYLIHTDTDNHGKSKSSHVRVVDRSNVAYEHNTQDFPNISASHNLWAYKLPSDDDIRGAAWITDAIETGWQYFDEDAPDFRIIKTITVEWDPDINTGASASGHKIILGGGDTDTDGDEHYRWVILHEYGHVVLSAVYDKVLGACPSLHSIENFTNPVCAWYEGWATFVAHAVDDEPNKIWTKTSNVDLEKHAIYSNNTRSIEFQKTDSSSVDIGHKVEGRVAAALWDIYDDADDRIYDLVNGQKFDGISHSDEKIFKIFSLDNPVSLEKWNSEWNERYPSNSVSKILKLHHMGFNIPPDADSLHVTVRSDTTTILYLTAKDVDGDKLQYQKITDPNHGTLSPKLDVFPTNTVGKAIIRYTPNDGFVGTDSFKFKAHDGDKFSTEATVTITVKPKPQPITFTASLDSELDSITLKFSKKLTQNFNTSDFTTSHGTIDRITNYDNSKTRYLHVSDMPYNTAVTVTYSGAGFTTPDNYELISKSYAKTNAVPKPDTAPSISDISDVTLNASQTKTVSITATDAESDPITLTLQAAPSFAKITHNGNGKATVTLNPDSSNIGTHTVTVKATANGKSDTEFFTVTVTMNTVSSDTPPVITPISNISLTDSQTLSFSVTATDKEGDIITLSLSSSPGFVTLTGNTIYVNPTSSDVGTHTVTIQATANGKSDTESFEITVIKTAIDAAPIISEIVDISMTDSQTRTITITATDADGDTISLSLQSSPNFVSIAGDTITVKPNMSDIGTHTVTVQATANGKTDTESFTVTVSQTIIDSPPVLTPQPDITLNHTETKTLAVTATDPDGDAITVSLARYTPDFVTIQSVPGNSTLLIKPALSDVGTHDIGIYADANGKRAVDVFKITILEEIIDAAPVISAIPNVSMFDSHTRAVTVTASDREGDTITLSLQSAPDFVTLSGNIIAIKPAKTDIGTYTVTVQAVANGKSDTQSFKVIVAKRVTFDTGPVMQTIPDITMIHTQTETLNVTVTDKENDIITMSLARYAPDFVTLLDKGGGKGTITINPDSSDVGVHYVGVFAYANGLFAGNTVRVAVTNVPADTVSPVFSNIPADIIQSTSSNKTLVTFVPPTATDDTDGTIQVISSHKSGILFPIGNTTVTFTATDSAGNKSIHNMIITITKTPPATPPAILLNDTFDGTLNSWTYKEIPYTPWIKTDCDTQNNNAYTLLYSTEHNGSAHLNYTAQCWFGMAGANKTITIPESQKDYYLQISLDHRSLADMRHYANVGNVNNHFMSITDSDGLIIQYVTLFQGESHGTIQDTAWRQKSIMLSSTDIARCPCDVFVYVSDYWRIPWKQQGYIDNVEMKFVHGVTGAVPEIQNSLTIDEYAQAVFANGTKIAITGKYVTDDTVLVSWEAFADATQYKAVIVPADTQAKTVHKKITNTLYEFTELEPDTAYIIKVMVADDPSTKSVITATTLGR